MENLGSGFCVELVHALTLVELTSPVKHKGQFNKNVKTVFTFCGYLCYGDSQENED